MQVPFSDLPFDPLQEMYARESIYKDNINDPITQEPSPSTDSEPAATPAIAERRPSLESRLASVMGKSSRKSDPAVSPMVSQVVIEDLRNTKDLIPLETNFVNGTIKPSKDSSEVKMSSEDSPLAAAAAWLTGTLSNSDGNLNKRILITPDGEQMDIASSRRNTEFHELFPELLENDILIEDFTCAWLNDILLHGRIYFSQNSISFYSKVIWTYSVSIPIQEVVGIEKKSVAGVFQNALEIKTASKKYFFASFLSRNQAYDVVTKIVAGHPNNIVQDNGVEAMYPRKPSTASLDSKRSKSVGSNEVLKSGLHRSKSLLLIEASSMGLADIANDDRETIPSRNSSPVGDSPSRSHIIHQKKKVSVPSQDMLATKPKPLLPVPKVEQTEPFECSCLPGHKEQKSAIDTVIPLSLKETWFMIYGYQSSFAKLFWEKLKYSEIKQSDWLPKESTPTTETTDHPTQFDHLKSGYMRKLSYIVPISNPMGPKQTNCSVIESIKHISQYQICMDSITQTPDVPSGSCFQARVSICLLFQTNKTTRMIVSSQVEYLKSTWIKMAIDHAVPEGIKDYHVALAKELDVFLKDKAMDCNDVVSSTPAAIPKPIQEPVSVHIPKEDTKNVNLLWVAFGILFIVNLIVLSYLVLLNTKLNKILGQLPSHTEL